MSSYLNGNEYGYDQISIGSDEFNQVLKTLDSNSIHKIPTIRERELRVFNKINRGDAPCEFAPFDVCNPDLYSIGGVQRKQLRDGIRKDIESYYYGTGDSQNSQLKYPPTNKKTENNHYPQSIFNDVAKKESMSAGGGGAAGGGADDDDIEHLHEEVEELERKNNMLVVFIFFLVVIVLIQYSKVNNDPMRILVLPGAGPKESAAEAKPANE